MNPFNAEIAMDYISNIKFHFIVYVVSIIIHALPVCGRLYPTLLSIQHLIEHLLLDAVPVNPSLMNPLVSSTKVYLINYTKLI